MTRLYSAIVMLLAILSSSASAGNLDDIREALQNASTSQTQEKVYLHTDNQCYFVGDTLSRDVVGPRRMGFGRVFKINSFLTPQKDLGKYDVAPDYQITDIYDVYTILKQERDNA